MFYFKACPKCSGDLHLDKDQYGSFIECVQCGLVRDVELNQTFPTMSNAPTVSASPHLTFSREALALTA